MKIRSSADAKGRKKRFFNNQSAGMRGRLKYGGTSAGSILKKLSQINFFLSPPHPHENKVMTKMLIIYLLAL